MAVAREDHGHASGVGGGNDLLVAHGATWLDAGGGTSVDGGLESVSEGEHGVGGDGAACEGETRFFGLPDGDA